MRCLMRCLNWESWYCIKQTLRKCFGDWRIVIICYTGELTLNPVVSVQRGFLFLWVLGMGCLILLRHTLSLPYIYFSQYSTVLS